MEQSQYSRRENGVTRISKKEWDKIAEVLNVPLEDIYEPHDGVYVADNEKKDDSSSQNNMYNLSDLAIDTMKKYIEKLEEQNAVFKQEIEYLRSLNN